MNKEEYVALTDETAVYPEAGSSSAREIMYLTLGLIGELGELNKDAAPAEIVPEAGDCYWYLLRLKRIVTPAELVDPYLLECVFDGARSIEHAPTPKLSAKLANTAKKVYRDGMTGEKRHAIWMILKEMEYYLDSIVATHGKSSASRVLEKNIDKLRSRKERNVLGGDGDNR